MPFFEANFVKFYSICVASVCTALFEPKDKLGSAYFRRYIEENQRNVQMLWITIFLPLFCFMSP